MEAYKFKTKVSENGTIVIPEGFDVKNKEVEVIILDEADGSADTKKMTGRDFVKQYAGMLQDVDADKAKWEYLKTKHDL